MELLAGWCPTTPQLAFKATFGYQVYDHCQAADLLGERLEQLRSGRARQEAAAGELAPPAARRVREGRGAERAGTSARPRLDPARGRRPAGGGLPGARAAPGLDLRL